MAHAQEDDGTYIDPRLLSVPPPHTPSQSKSNSRVTRPPNAFLIFRSEMIDKLKLKDIETDQRNISRIVSHLWNDLPDDQKENYRQAADIRRLQHQLEHPDYKYQPSAASESPKEKRRRHGVEDEVARTREAAKRLKHSTEYQYSPISSQGANEEARQTHATTARTSSSQDSPVSHYPSSSTHAPTASYYPAAPHHPSSSTVSSSSYAYPPPQHSSSGGYPEHCHQYQQGSGDDDPTDAQLRSLMEHFNH